MPGKGGDRDGAAARGDQPTKDRPGATKNYRVSGGLIPAAASPASSRMRCM
jgi:hypothetical protein